jgi:hypothetical protein
MVELFRVPASNTPSPAWRYIQRLGLKGVNQ